MTNGIPEWLTVELILGIYASLIGTLSLFLYLIKLRREKPHLTISFAECSHIYSKPSAKVGLLCFNPLIRIKNTGDRGTTASKVELAFRLNSEEFIEFTEGDRLGHRKIDAHDVIDLRPGMCSNSHSILNFMQQERIPCTFTVYHTHGLEKVECISEMSM